MLTGKHHLAVLLVVTALLSFFPSNQHAAVNITNKQIVRMLSETPVEQPAAKPSSKGSRDLPRSELLEFLFADVSVHGVPAAFISSMVKIAFASK